MNSDFIPGRNQNAYALFHGLLYQVQHTILAWLELDEGSELELEYGEDLDHLLALEGIGNEYNDDQVLSLKRHDLAQQRILEQIKYRTGNLTLRSSEALQSVADFQKHLDVNPPDWSSISLAFRFTTNAKPGKERDGNPNRQKLIELWNDLRVNADGSDRKNKLRYLRDFIATIEPGQNLSQETVDSVQTAFNNADDIVIDFIRRFEWNMAAGDTADLEYEIFERCRERGCADEEECQEIYSRLFFTVFNLLSIQNRDRLSVANLEQCIAQEFKVSGRERERFETLITHLNELSIQNSLSIRALERRLAVVEERTNPIKQAESAWVPWETYFQPWLDEKKIFHHQNELIGRERHRSDLKEFLDTGHKVAVLHGVGGMGKSKVLMDFAREHHKDYRIVFLKQGCDSPVFHPDIFAGEQVVLIVDDSHRVDEHHLVQILSGALREKRIKMLFATRPAGVDKLKEVMRGTGLSSDNFYRLELNPLSINEAQLLVEEILGQEHSTEALAYLVKRANGVPLILVGLASLLKRKERPLWQIEIEEEFEGDVLKHLILGVTQELPDSRLQKDWMNILEFIAATQPFSVQDRAFVTIAAEYLGIREREFQRALVELADLGIVWERGHLRELKPDLVAEHILGDACFTRDDVDTGFVEELLSLFEHDKQKCFTILRNVLSLSVAGSNRQALEQAVPSAFWDSLYNEAETGAWSAAQALNGFHREKLPSLIPKQTLILVDLLIGFFEPLDELGSHQEFPWELRDAVQCLRSAGYRPDFAPQVCELLWRIGSNDGRALSNHLEHGFRVSQDLIEYHLVNNPCVVDELVRRMESLIQNSRQTLNGHHPLLLLKPVFNKTIQSGYYLGSGQGITSKRFVLPERVGTQWSKALSIIRHELVHGDISASTKMALEVLEHALEPAFVRWLKVPAWLEEAWVPLRAEAMDILESFADSPMATPWYIQIVDICGRLMKHNAESRLGPRAQVILEALEESNLMRWHRVLLDLSPWKIRNELNLDWHQEQETNRIEQRAFAIELLERLHREPKAFIQELEQVLCQFEYAKVTFTQLSTAFGQVLVEEDSAFARALCEKLIEGQAVKAKKFFLSTVLNAARRIQLPWAEELTATLVEGSLENQLSAAHSLGWHWNMKSGTDFESLRRLLHSDEPEVRAAVVHALTPLIRQDYRAAIELVKQGPAGDDGAVWKGFFHAWWSALGRELEEMMNRLSKSDIREILDLIERYSTNDNNDHDHAIDIVKAVANQHPDEVFEFLFRRLKFKSFYRYELLTVKKLALSTNKDGYLLSIAEFVRDHRVSWPNDFYAVFWGICGEEPLRGLDCLQSLMKEADETSFDRLVELLLNGPLYALFTTPDYLEWVLVKADGFRSDNEDWIRQKILARISHSLRGRPIGEPDPVLLEQKEKIIALIVQNQLSNRIKGFYINLVEDIDKHIEKDRKHDLESGL